jgi:tetratricopeptide (TPR) repeat protein
MTNARTRWIAVGGLVVVAALGYAAYRIAIYRWGWGHLLAAQEALQRRDFRQASLRLENCLLYRPDDPAVRLLAAQTARRQGEYTRARQHLSQCARGEASERERLLLRVQEGDLIEARTLLATCVERPQAPETPLILEAALKGSVAALPRNWREVSLSDRIQEDSFLGLVRRGIDLWLERAVTPADRAQGLHWRGLLLRLSSEHTAAVADFRQALEIAPEHFEARVALTESIADESPREAASHLQWLHDRDPANTSVRFSLAIFRHRLGQLEEASRLLDGLLVEDPDNVSMLIERGRLALDLHQSEDAEKWLRRALTLDPKRGDAHLFLGRCLQVAGKSEEAARHYEQFLRIEAAQKSEPR